MRLWVEGADELDVWALVTEFQRRAQTVAPEGLQVRYVQLREPERAKGFTATMRRRRGRKAA